MNILYRHVQIEITRDGREHAGDPRGNRRGGVHNHQPGLAGKMNRQGGGKRQMHLEMAQPLEAFRRAKLGAGGIVADRTPVIGDKTKRRLLRIVVRHHLVIRVGEGIGVDPGEMGDVQKALDLAARKAVNLKGRAVDLLKAVVVPVRHHRQRHRVLRVEGQAGPDQAIAFLNRKAGEVELRRYRLVGAGRDTVTAAIFAEAQAVVRADDPFFVVKTERQRHAAVGTDVASDHHLALDTIDNQLFIKQGGFYRRGADIAGARDRMPAFRQAQPVLGLKGAMGGRGGLWFVHGFSSCSQKHLFNCCEFIVAILGC